MLYTLNLHTIMGQFYLNKAGSKLKQGKNNKKHSTKLLCTKLYCMITKNRHFF